MNGTFPVFRKSAAAIALLALVLTACNLPAAGHPSPPAPTLAPLPKPSPLPVASPTPPPPTSSPSPAGPCTLTATADATAYNRPSTHAQVFGTVSAGTSLTPQYRTADGWYGFEPGVAQAGNVGIFRMRWVQGKQGFQIRGACAQLPLAPPLPAGVCFLMPMTTLTVRSAPAATAASVGTLTPQQYAAVTGRGPDDWVLLNLNQGQNSLSGQGWASLADGGLNGPCDSLPSVQPPTASAPTAATPPQSRETRIQFASGAITWQAPVNASGNYVFGAMQEQSAEMLVLHGDQPADAALALAAPNGQPLQTYNIGRPDWRGMLPQTGDYHISIAAPHGTAGLTLRVTIYPPLRQPQAVTDTGVGFKVLYDRAIAHRQLPGYFPHEVFGVLLAAGDFYTNTNLSEAYFVISLEDYHDRDTCLNAPPDAAEVNALGTWRVNNVDYRYYHTEEGAAGSLYQSEFFRTYVHTRCITVRLFTHETNIGNYDSGSVTPYDRQRVLSELKRIFFTLRWP